MQIPLDLISYDQELCMDGMATVGCKLECTSLYSSINYQHIKNVINGQNIAPNQHLICQYTLHRLMDLK